jgi:hypothetical protein
MGFFTQAGALGDLLLANPYPGYALVFPCSVGYKLYLWQDLFVGLFVSPQYLVYFDNNAQYLASGFQLFLQLQVGYRFDIEILGLPAYLKLWAEVKWEAYYHDQDAPQSFQDINRQSPTQISLSCRVLRSASGFRKY